MPRKRIFADCYAALNPSDELWRRYLDECGRLREQGAISEDELYLLKFSAVARSALMENTLGTEQAFAEGTVYDVLRHAKESAVKEVQMELAVESRHRLLAEDRAREAERALQDERDSHRKRLDRIALAFGKGCAGFVFSVFLAALVAGTVLSYVYPLSNSPWVKWPARVLLPLVSVLSVLNLAFGVTLRRIAARIRDWAARPVRWVMTREPPQA